MRGSGSVELRESKLKPRWRFGHYCVPLADHETCTVVFGHVLGLDSSFVGNQTKIREKRKLPGQRFGLFVMYYMYGSVRPSLLESTNYYS